MKNPPGKNGFDFFAVSAVNSNEGMRLKMFVFFCFTEDGYRICQRLEAFFSSQKIDCRIYFFQKELYQTPLSSLTEQAFSEAEAIFFVSACGIAVRSIAPFLKKKTSDPAVLVIDDTASFVIPLLSGHIGGANELAENAAAFLHAVPVITTSTDRHHIFSVDSFAKQHHLSMRILSETEQKQTDPYPGNAMELAKKISAALLRKETVFWDCAFPINKIPAGLTKLTEETLSESKKQKTKKELCIRVDIKKKQAFSCFPNTLLLIPQIVHIGIGCKKNISKELLYHAFFSFLSRHSLYAESIAGIASIDLKKEEPALLNLKKMLGIPFTVYSKEELSRLPGNFTGSDFVASVTGVDNICERSAVLSSREGNLIIPKTILEDFGGITFAAAVSRITF